MDSRIPKNTSFTITLEEYRNLNLKRPYTDSGIGATTASNRSLSALTSATFTTESPFSDRTGKSSDPAVNGTDGFERRKGRPRKSKSKRS